MTDHNTVPIILTPITYIMIFYMYISVQMYLWKVTLTLGKERHEAFE